MEGVQEILSRAGIFQGVDPVAVQNLIEQMETVRFPRGTTIFEEGEPGDRLYIITSGKIKLARHAPDGRENLLTVMGPVMRRVAPKPMAPSTAAAPREWDFTKALKLTEQPSVNAMTALPVLPDS